MSHDSVYLFPPPPLSLSPISLCVPSQHVSDLCLTSEAISHPVHVCLSHLCPHQFHLLSCSRPGWICHLHGPDTRWGSHWSLLEPTNLTDRSYCSSMVNLTHRRSLEQLLCQWCLCWYYLGWHLTICFCWHCYADLPHWVLCCQGGLWLLWVCCLLSIFFVHYHLQWPLCRLLFILFCCCVLIIRYIYISGSWNSTFQGSIQTDSMDPSLQDKKGETLPKLWVCDNQTSSLCQALDSFLYTPRHKSLPRHILLTLLLVASSLAIGMTTNDFGVVLAFNVRYNSFPLSSWASKLNLS